MTRSIHSLRFFYISQCLRALRLFLFIKHRKSSTQKARESIRLTQGRNPGTTRKKKHRRAHKIIIPNMVPKDLGLRIGTNFQEVTSGSIKGSARNSNYCMPPGCRLLDSMIFLGRNARSSQKWNWYLFIGYLSRESCEGRFDIRVPGSAWMSPYENLFYEIFSRLYGWFRSGSLLFFRLF